MKHKITIEIMKDGDFDGYLIRDLNNWSHFTIKRIGLIQQRRYLFEKDMDQNEINDLMTFVSASPIGNGYRVYKDGRMIY